VHVEIGPVQKPDQTDTRPSQIHQNTSSEHA
jgi:hypothetical protein